MYSSSVFKQFNWVPTPSAYQSAEAWRSKRSAMAADFQSQASDLANSFTTATINQVIGMGNLVATAAGQRLQDEAKAKSAAAGGFDLSSLNLSI